MRLNTTDASRPRTHEGAPARRISAEQELRRSVMACLLWEDTFYEDGVDVATRITKLVSEVAPGKVYEMAVDARNQMKLRHAPLLLAVALARSPLAKRDRHYIADTVEAVVQRADELAELLAIYSQGRSGRKQLNKLSKQLQKGLARAFTKFNEYQLAKYDRAGKVRLRDVLFLTHAKPKDKAQAALWRRLVKNQLKTPDTWEVALTASEGEDKKAVWTRLLREEKLGGLALLRNLRNMKEVGVDDNLVKRALATMDTEKLLPFRFVAAAKHAPQLEPEIEAAMLRSLARYEKMPGKTALVVDHSGSMDSKLSGKSDLTRDDAACALAILIREICEDAVVIAFSDQTTVIPARRGFALRDAIQRSPSGGTYTDLALARAQHEGYDRVIVITDEQSHQAIRNPSYNGMPKKGYVVNVATNQNGIGYGAWTHIDGWSEAVVEYIRQAELA